MFNDTWDLIDKADRCDADDDQMLLTAMASRWHWGQVGTAEQAARGDWQVAHVFGLVRHGEVAVRFARRHLATANAEGWDGWWLASAHEGMAGPSRSRATGRVAPSKWRQPRRLWPGSLTPRIAAPLPRNLRRYRSPSSPPAPA